MRVHAQPHFGSSFGKPRIRGDRDVEFVTHTTGIYHRLVGVFLDQHPAQRRNHKGLSSMVGQAFLTCP